MGYIGDYRDRCVALENISFFQKVPWLLNSCFKYVFPRRLLRCSTSHAFSGSYHPESALAVQGLLQIKKEFISNNKKCTIRKPWESIFGFHISQGHHCPNNFNRFELYFLFKAVLAERPKQCRCATDVFIVYPSTHRKDVRLPVQLQRAMAAEAEAAREARAKVRILSPSHCLIGYFLFGFMSI